MIATIYFWSKEIGTLELTGEYEPNRRQDEFDNDPGRSVVSARPIFQSIPTAPFPYQATERLKVGMKGLLWRTGKHYVEDMIPVIVSDMSKNFGNKHHSLEIGFCSDGPFIVSAGKMVLQ